MSAIKRNLSSNVTKTSHGEKYRGQINDDTRTDSTAQQQTIAPSN